MPAVAAAAVSGTTTFTLPHLGKLPSRDRLIRAGLGLAIAGLLAGDMYVVLHRPAAEAAAGPRARAVAAAIAPEAPVQSDDAGVPASFADGGFAPVIEVAPEPAPVTAAAVATAPLAAPAAVAAPVGPVAQVPKPASANRSIASQLPAPVASVVDEVAAPVIAIVQQVPVAGPALAQVLAPVVDSTPAAAALPVASAPLAAVTDAAPVSLSAAPAALGGLAG